MSMFQYEWLDDVEPSVDRIAQHTMARISINVGDQVVTSVYDRYLKDYRDHIFVPLAHIAEWLAVNWWHLWYESANVSGEQRPGFLSRHDLAHAGNGFVLPRLIFTPMGGQIHVAARRWNPRYAPLEFRTECFVMVGRDELEQEFRVESDGSGDSRRGVRSRAGRLARGDSAMDRSITRICGTRAERSGLADGSESSPCQEREGEPAMVAGTPRRPCRSRGIGRGAGEVRI